LPPIAKLVAWPRNSDVNAEVRTGAGRLRQRAEPGPMSLWLGGPTVSRASLCPRVVLGASVIVGVWKATTRPPVTAPAPQPMVTAPPPQQTETLYDAAERGDRETVRRLLAAGADPNAPTEDASPLSCAARNGDLEMATLLLRHGANVNPKDESPLAWASYADQNRLPMMRLLIHAGADVNARFGRGCTVLSVVRFHGGDEAVALLKKSGSVARRSSLRR
jgi:Ankyrin repeats (3 copies)